MRRGDHFIARLHAQGMHGYVQGISSVRAGDALPGLHCSGEFALERIHERAPDVCRLANHCRDGRVDVALYGKILRVQVRERYRSPACLCHSFSRDESCFNRRSRRAGFPAYTPATLMSLVTTAPAPMTTSSQIDTGNIVALEPMDTRAPTRVARHNSRRPLAGPPV